MICEACRKHKSLDDFIRTKSGGYQRTCRRCRENPPNPAKVLLKQQKNSLVAFNYRGRKYKLPYIVELKHVLFCWEFWDNRCAVCYADTKDLVLDHWVALRDDDCPGSTPDNMILLCRSCNLEKEYSNPHEWLRGKLGDKATVYLMKRIDEYFKAILEIQP